MRHKIYAAVAAVAVMFAVLAAGWGGRAQGPARKTWEYKVVTAHYGAQPASINEQELNRLGAEGWELVETRSMALPQGSATLHRTDYFFKRLR